MKNLSIVCMLAIAFTSCGTSKGVYSSPASAERQTEVVYASNEQAVEQPTGPQQRIVIYNAYVRLVVKSPDSTNIRLATIANKYEGYVQTLGNRASIIRVKADKLQLAVADISGLGKVKNKTISGDDVTEQYTDFQIRLDNAYNARKRYLELLAKAENVETALQVEKELERLNGEIDSLEGKINRLKHLFEHSTITISMDEKVKPGIVGYIGIGLYRSVKWLFVRN